MARSILGSQVMKVCIITTQFPIYPGDHHAPFIYHAARALHANGVEIKVVAMHRPGAKKHEIWDGIEIFRPQYLPDRWEILQKDEGGLPMAWQRGFMSRLAFIPFGLVHTLATAKHSADCDLIHANWTLSAIAANMSFFLHKLPFIVTVHGSDIFYTPRKPLLGKIVRNALVQSERVIAVSRSLAEATQKHGVSSDKLKIIPDGVDTNVFQPHGKKRENLILFVGSFTETKGVGFLIQALPSVLKEFPKFRLVLIGDGPLREALKAQCTHLGISENVDFLGTQDQMQVADWMRRVKLLILPSIKEGLGVVLLEALASGTPCIASNTGGIPDVINSDVGQLVPTADSHSLSVAIRSLLKDKRRYQAMSKHARRLALRKFDWIKIGQQIKNLYSEVINK